MEEAEEAWYSMNADLTDEQKRTTEAVWQAVSVDPAHTEAITLNIKTEEHIAGMPRYSLHETNTTWYRGIPVERSIAKNSFPMSPNGADVSETNGTHRNDDEWDHSEFALTVTRSE